MKKYVIIDLTGDSGRNFLISKEKVEEYSKKLGYGIGQYWTLTDAMVFDSEVDAEAELLKRKISGTTVIAIYKF